MYSYKSNTTRQFYNDNKDTKKQHYLFSLTKLIANLQPSESFLYTDTRQKSIVMCFKTFNNFLC